MALTVIFQAVAFLALAFDGHGIASGEKQSFAVAAGQALAVGSAAEALPKAFAVIFEAPRFVALAFADVDLLLLLSVVVGMIGVGGGV